MKKLILLSGRTATPAISSYGEENFYQPKIYKIVEKKSKLFLFYLLLTTVVVFFMNTTLKAQNNRYCLIDNTLLNSMMNDVGYASRVTAVDNFFSANQILGSSVGLKIIPVTFNIFYDNTNGINYITNAQIFTQLEALNMAYLPYNIQFCLATKFTNGISFSTDANYQIGDPLGVFRINSTNSLISLDITSISTFQTDLNTQFNLCPTGGNKVNYLNIIISQYTEVHQTGSTNHPSFLGYGVAPFQTAPSDNGDGIILNSSIVGNMSNPNCSCTLDPNNPNGKVLVHEAGHYLGLYHPFDNTTNGGLGCYQNAGNCISINDKLCDTYSQAFPSSYGLTTMSCDYTHYCDNDIYMDYHSDYYMTHFTNDESSRMTAFLSIGTPSNRNILWDNTNVNYINVNMQCGQQIGVPFIIADGVYNTSSSIPYSICTNSVTSFTGGEFVDVFYDWNFGDGTIATGLTTTNTTHSYTTNGNYTVTLSIHPISNTSITITALNFYVNVVSCINGLGTWHVGQSGGIKINNTGATGISKSKMVSTFSSTTINDANGNLIFYTNGEQVWDENHNPINNVFLIGNESNSSQGVMALQNTYNINEYYLFTIPPTYINNSNYLPSYSIITHGSGTVTISNQNTPIPLPSGATGFTSMITAVKKPCSSGYWVIMKGSPADASFNTSIFVYDLAFNSTTLQGSLTGPAIYNMPNMINYDFGSLEASPDGNYIAITGYDNFKNGYGQGPFNYSSAFGSGLMKFNWATGIPTWQATIAYGNFGLSFSPNSNFLYLSENDNTSGGSTIYQYDIATQGIAFNQYLPIDWYCAMQLAPNGKIYMTHNKSTLYSNINNSSWANAYTNDLYYINTPNTSGSGCGLTTTGSLPLITIPNLSYPKSTSTLPNLLDAYSTSAVSYPLTQNSSTVGPIVSNSIIDIPANGVFLIDNPLTISGCTFLMNDNSKIQLVSNPLTILNSSFFNACGTQLWQGIYADYNNEVISATNSTFKDALHAIDCANDVNFTLDGNRFENNYIGLNVNNYTSFSSTITNNTFTQTALLKANTQPNPNKAFSGISGTGMNALTVGDATAGGNTFDNTIYGIYTVGCNLTAYNNTFSHHINLTSPTLGWQNYEGAGIKVMGGTGGDGWLANSFQTIGGTGFNQKNTFTDCYMGVDIAKSAGLNIKWNDFFEMHNAAINIVTPFTKSTFPDINNGVTYTANNIYHNLMQEVANGIRINNVPSGSYINILNNHIDADASYALMPPAPPYPVSPPTSTGISVSGLLGTTQHQINIKYTDINKAHIGIAISNIKAPIIFYNEIEPKGTNVTYPSFSYPYAPITFINTGIRVANCPYNRVTENSIDGQFNTNFLTKGISISNSPHSIPQCNVSSQTGKGIEFYLDEQSSDMAYNLFQECRDGFVLNNGLMNDQGTPTFANYNKWTNGAVAVWHGQLYEPVHNSLQPNINFYCPNSVGVSSPTSINGHFYVTGINPLNTDACSNIGGGGGGSDYSIAEQILNGEWAIEGYENNTDEIARLHLYVFLTASDEELNNDASLIDRRDNLLQQLEIQQFIYDFENSDLKDLLNINTLLEQGDIAGAMAANNAILSNDGYIIKAKDYYELYMQYLNDETILTDSLFRTQVLSIASSCPLQYGSTVYMAQAMYHLIDPFALFEDDNLCNIEAARKANPVKPTAKKKRIVLTPTKDENLLTIYPNPSDGNFKVSCNNISGNVNIEVINVLGEVVYKNATAAFIEGNFSIDLGNVNTGIYYVRIMSNTNVFTKSLVISKQ